MYHIWRRLVVNKVGNVFFFKIPLRAEQKNVMNESEQTRRSRLCSSGSADDAQRKKKNTTDGRNCGRIFREVIPHPANDVVHEMRHISHVSGRQRDRWNTLPCSTATLLETGPCGADSNRRGCYSIFNSSDKARGAT